MYFSRLIPIALSSLLVLIAARARADEGMYPLHDTSFLPADEMKKQGLELEPRELLELRGAVAKVAGGGSGSFVSEDGLLVTNHHVAYRCIAALDGTSKHAGIMEEGFTAASRADEIPCPNYDLMVVEDVRDITDEVRAAVRPEMKGHRRFEAIRLAMDDLESECQEEKRGRFCSAEPLDGGRFYHMMVYQLIKDVRLVYAPEKDIGKYGGDVDNWRYPRHTGDYTFLRAYAAPDGTGADHSSDNVPYQPATHLEVSTEGVGRGDFVAVIGFPARTRRNYPSASARFAAEVDMPARKKLYGEMIELIGELGKEDEVTARRYQWLDAALNNAVKYYTDSLAGFEKWKLVEKRKKRDAQVEATLKEDRRARREHGNVLRRIERVYRNYERVYPKHFMLQRLAWLVKSAGVAHDIARWTVERKKPDRMRKDEAYKNKNMYKTVGKSDTLDDQITITGEKALLIHLLRQAEKLPKKARVRAVEKLVRRGRKAQRELKREARQEGGEYDERYTELTGSQPSDDPIRTAVDLMYARTALVAHSDEQEEKERALFQRRRLFYNPPADARRFEDPLLDFGRDVARELQIIEKGPFRAVEETFDTVLRPAYASLIEAPFPDANFQLRLSHGKVDDYTASDSGETHRYLTGLKGVIAKDEGEYPFRVPDRLAEAAAGDKGPHVDPRIDDVPVNFTCTLDTTGGNSGSPVVDGRGRLVGLLFDGTPESVLSDWQFLPDDQRSIVLDIRYALFLADRVHGAGDLLEEIGADFAQTTPAAD
ncbi:MAG: S46 family peptidase [Polyangia bacterium]